MALRYGYFDSDIIGTDEEGMPIFDRAETSDLFALLFANLVSDGVLALPGDCFQVKGGRNGLTLNVQPGFGMVRGHFAYNDEVLPLTIEAAPQTYSRIDRVILRCNYLERLVEIIVKTGEEAASPVPPELIRPAAGDYYELCLAEIRLTAGQQVITDSSVSDTRPNSAVCGYITQLIDHLDTAVFYDQFNAFYAEFVDRSNTTFTQFQQMAQERYDQFNTDISQYIENLKTSSKSAYDDYIARMGDYFTGLTEQSQTAYNKYISDLSTFWNDLQKKGNADYETFNSTITQYIAELEARGDGTLAAIVQQMMTFRETNEAEFLEWFETIKGIFSGDPGGAMQEEIQQLQDGYDDLLTMLVSGMVSALMLTDDGDYICDDTGTPLLIDWPICKCAYKN
nr:MAG TPA: Receptor Binding Protein [Caudoviricetes sp.]